MAAIMVLAAASAGASVLGSLRAAWSHRAVRMTIIALAAFYVIAPAWVLFHVYFDRRNLPDIEPFLRFEPPRIGEVYDVRGGVLIQLAREYRRVVSFDEVPPVVREAVLAAEDKNFFSHSGVDYSALPRVVRKTASSSLTAWRSGESLRLQLPQGGSTLTQQLVRAYFLSERTSLQEGDVLFHDGAPQKALALVLGVPVTNKLLRKLEEVRLALWLEAEMRRRYGTKAQAKREIFARSASFHYMGHGRYGLAAASELYFGKPLSSYTIADAGSAALLAGIGKSPRDYAPSPDNPRSLRRRNQILALMARNGAIPESLAKRCQAEPVRIAPRPRRKTNAPAAIGHVFAELNRHGGFGFGVGDLVEGRISVLSTVDDRVQIIVNEALENGLALYETRHPHARGLVQGSVVVLRNSNAAVLAEAGGRQTYNNRDVRYSDLNRVTGSLRQPGSTWKPVVYLAAFQQGLTLDTAVPDEPIGVSADAGGATKWIANYDRQFKGPIPLRQALAESRNSVAMWLAREIGLGQVLRTARDLGIRTPLRPYPSTALGASEVRLLELAGAYRAMASGILAEPHVIRRVVASSGKLLYEVPRPGREISSGGLRQIQEGLRGVVRLPGGTAHGLDGRAFPIAVMGKTGTSTDYRDALFVGSTYGPQGITVAVRIGFDDNRRLGRRETGARTALPIFREIMLRVYAANLVGAPPKFPRAIEAGIDRYLELLAQDQVTPLPDVGVPPPDRVAGSTPSTWGPEPRR